MNNGLLNARKVVFPSGLTVVHEHNPQTSMVAYQLWIRVGSVCESKDQKGIAHFLEHMVFRGSENTDAYALNNEIETYGGTINAFTSYDETAFFVSLPSRHWKRGLDLLFEILTKPRLDSEDMEIERKVILEEQREGEDSLENTLGEKLFEDLYPGLPYGKPVIGTAESISSLRYQDLLHFFRKWYVPSNMVLTISGDISWSEIQAAITDYRLPKMDRPEGPAGSSWSNDEQFTYTSVQKGLEERFLDVAFPMPGILHEDIPALDVIAVVLGEGETSRLHREVRLKRRLVRSVDTSLFAPFGPGKFFLHTIPYQGRVLETLKELLFETRKLCRKKVPTDELMRAKLMLEKDLLFSDETVEGRAKTLAYYEATFGDHEEERRYREEILSVTPSKIQEVANRYFDTENIGIALLLPEKEEVPTESEIKETLEAPVKRKSKSIYQSQKEAKNFELENGLRVILLSRRNTPVASVYAAMKAGLRTERKSNNGISNLVAISMDQGTKSRTPERLAEDTVLCQADICGLVGRDTLGLRMDLPSTQLRPGLDIFSEIFLHPRFDSDIVGHEKRVALNELEAQKDSFEALSSYHFYENIFRGHPYGLNFLGTKESVTALDSEALRAHYLRYLQPRRSVISIVGDFELEDVCAQVEEKFTVFESGPLQPIEPNPLSEISSMQEFRRPIYGEKSYIFYGFRGCSISHPDRYPLEVLATLLCSFGSGRLYTRLREELGLAYSVEVATYYGWDGGYFGVTLNTVPDRVDLALEETRRILSGMRKDVVLDEEIQRVKNFMIGSFESDLQRSGVQASYLTQGLLFQNTLNFDEHIQRLLKVTPETVLEVARNYLTLDRGVYVILSPSVH